MVKIQQSYRNAVLVGYSDAKAMPSDIASRCRSLSFRDEGEMRSLLTHSRSHPSIMASVVVAMIEGTDTVLGWSILSKGNYNYKSPEVMVYVRNKFRRQGYGSCLIRNVMKYADPNETVMVYYPDGDPFNHFYMTHLSDPRFKQG